MRNQTIIGLGLINQDLLAVTPGWERDGKTNATAFIEQVGGPVPVALQAVRRLGGVEAALLGVVGTDTAGDELLDKLQEDGIKISQAQRAPHGRTSRSLVIVDSRDGARSVVNWPGELPSLSWTPARENLLRRAALVHLDGRDLPACRRAAEIVRETGGTVSLDLGTVRPGVEKLLPRCDIILAAQKGGAGAFPKVADDPAAQVARFLEIGARIAGVTLGAAGLVIGSREIAPVHLPAFPVEKTADTCGAGDVFHGAFLWAHGQNRDLLFCARFAQAAAALRIQRLGNNAGLPMRAAIEQFLAEHDAG